MFKKYTNLKYLLLCLCLMGYSLTSLGQTDAAILEVLSPQEGFSCDGGNSITPEFIIGNVGAVPISLLFYTVTIDGMELTTAPVTGIGLGEETTLSLDPIELEPGLHSITFEIGNVNGTPDSNPGNNTQTIDFEISSGLGVSLELLTDDFGEEISMEIIDENGETVANVEQGSLEDNEEYNYDYCLGTGCYTFNIEDSFGDGICCGQGEGYYTLTNSYGQVLGTGGDYGDGESFEFCLETIILENLDAAIISIEPEGNFCATNIDPSFTFRNDGETNITSAVFEYSLNGTVLGELDWEGDIASFETVVLNLPNITDLELGSNSLSVNIFSVNGTNDNNADNDNYSSDLEIIGDSGFTVYLDVAGGGGGGGGAQRTYTLLDSEGNIIDEINPLQNNSEPTLPYCFPEGCFTIVTTSTGGGNGGVDFQVIADAGFTVAVSPDQWNQELTLDFCTTPPANLDGAVTEIYLPVDGQEFCGGSVAPSFEFTNLGLESLTEAVFEYEIEGTLYAYEWTGELANLESEKIDLPLIEDLELGAGSLTISILSVNGGADGNDLNDVETSDFEVIDGLGFIVFLSTDGGPPFLERTYEIADEDGNIIESIDLDNGEDYEFAYCFPEGCFTITATDGFGTGGVDFTVLANAGYIIAVSEGFTDELITEFCTTPPVNMDASISEIPFPTDNSEVCGTSISPIVTLTNQGLENLTSATIEYTVGFQSGTFEWTGDLEYLKSEDIELPALDGFAIGDFDLLVSVISINGGMDEVSENNSLSTSFAFTDGDAMTLTIETGEGFLLFALGVLITDLNENPILEQEGFEESTTYTFNLCEDPACFVLNFYNTFGGGGPGGGDIPFDYILTDAEGNVLVSGSDLTEDIIQLQYCSPNAEILDYDVSLPTIISPEDGQDDICGAIAPEFVFTNLGGETVNSLTIEYSLNGEAPQTFEWTGNVPQFEGERIVLPSLGSLTAGDYDLNINIVAINGEADEDDSNNSESVSFEVINAEGVSISVTPNGQGFPIGFSLIDENGDLVDEQQGFPGGETTTETSCLPIGCYTLTATDFFGEGNADFVIENSLGVLLAEIEAPYGNETSVEFCTTPLDLAAIDGGVNAILEPNSTLCNSTINPVFEFINNGLENITEIVFEYVYDGSVSQEETWTGNLGTYEEVTIQLPELADFTSGDHDLTINIISVNGQDDNETDNNSLSQSFNISDAEPFILNFQADIFPQDNSYQITNDNDEVIFSGEQGVFENPFGLNTEDLCLYSGCYTLTLFDNFGDGGPSVSITDSNGEILIEGTSTGPELNLDFCIDGLVEGINDLPETAKIELFPNPSNGIFYLNHQLEGNYQITVQDLLGRKMLSQQLTNGQNTIDLGNNTANGIYLLTIENGSEMGVYKITLVR